MNNDLINIIQKINTSKREIFWQIIIIFIIPIILIQTGVIPISQRFITLTIITVLFISVLITEKWTPSMLGVKRNPFLKKHIISYSIFTIVGLLFINLFGEKIGQEELTHWWTYSHFLYLFFFVSTFQEILYRGYLIPAIGKLSSRPLVIILCNALVFTFLHAIFPDRYVGLPLALIGGIGFAIMYIKYPNLILIILSHSILNFYAVLYGFFTIPGMLN